MPAHVSSDASPAAPVAAAERRLDDVAALASAASRGVVVICVPSVGEPGRDSGSLRAVRDYVHARLMGQPAALPGDYLDEVPVEGDGTPCGSVVLLGDRRVIAANHRVVLELAAVAASAIARAGAEASVVERARSLVDGLRSDPGSAAATIARAGDLGVELRNGAVALRAQGFAASTTHIRALVSEVAPSALVSARGSAVDALIPGPPAATEVAAPAVAHRLRAIAHTAFSTHEATPDRLGYALREAAVGLKLLQADRAPADVTGGTWRLLVRMAVRDPQSVADLRTSTLGPALAYDDAHGTELVSTFETWMAHGANMNAAAAAMPAHRHTVAYRLARLGELCGLDPMQLDDRERLSLALKAGAVGAARDAVLRERRDTHARLPV